MGIIGILISGPALEFMKTPEEIMRDSRIYLYIYFGGLVFNLIYNVGSSILRAVGDSKRPPYVLIVTCILNIILDIILVVWVHMGVTGVAVATVFSPGGQCGYGNGNASEKRYYVPASFEENCVSWNGSSLHSLYRTSCRSGICNVQYCKPDYSDICK